MDPIKNLFSLRKQAYNLFPEKGNIVTRIFARIPIFFLSIAALFNEVVLGIHPVPLDVRHYDLTRPDPSTEKTRRVSMQIFALLWRKPSSEEKSRILNPLIPRLPDTQTVEVSQLSQNAVDQMLANIQNQAFVVETNELMGESGILLESTVSSIREVAKELGDFNKTISLKKLESLPAPIFHIYQKTRLDLDHLPRSLDRAKPKGFLKISAADLEQAKAFLMERFGTHCLSYSLISEIPETNENMKMIALLRAILFDQVGTIRELNLDYEEYATVLDQFKNAQEQSTSPLYKKGLSFETIKVFCATLPRTTPDEISTANRAEMFLQRHLESILFTQVDADMNRRTFTLRIRERSGSSGEEDSTVSAFPSYNEQAERANRIPKDLWGFHLRSKLLEALEGRFPGETESNHLKATVGVYSMTQTVDAMFAQQMLPGLMETLDAEKAMHPELENFILLGNPADVTRTDRTGDLDRVELVMTEEGNFEFEASHDRRITLVDMMTSKRRDFITHFQFRGTLDEKDLRATLFNTGISEHRIS